MKRLLIRNESSDVFGMANLIPRRTGLQANIWSEHSGILYNVSHTNNPLVKIKSGDYQVSVTIEENPKILIENTFHLKKSDELNVKEAIDYIGRNYDVFLKHYLDENDDFDDEDLFNSLRERGEYK